MKSSFAMPLIVMILLIAVLALATGCTTNSYEHPQSETNLVPGIFSTANERLDAIRKKNFSVLRTEMVLKGLSMDNPMLIRAFKSEMKLELWVKSAYHDHYELFKTYDICNKSGVLGPKLQEGDQQTPEGFYDVTRKRLNPNSRFFLSFNIGFPNAYDRAHQRTGTHLMIHGGCASEGCLAMTDEHIAEIYLIVEQNFKYGHKSIPIHIYPFRMTNENMMARNLSRWYPFWENLKVGYDYFEKYYVPPAISVKNKQYVFNHQSQYY